jgi:hypothetical protein
VADRTGSDPGWARSKGEREELGEEELGEEEKSLVGHEVRRAWISRPMTVW